MGNQKKSGISIKLHKDYPDIPYLMFVDGCIIFSEGQEGRGS